MYLFPQLKNKFTTKENYGNKRFPYIHLFPYTACSFTWVPGKEQKSPDPTENPCFNFEGVPNDRKKAPFLLEIC